MTRFAALVVAISMVVPSPVLAQQIGRIGGASSRGTNVRINVLGTNVGNGVLNGLGRLNTGSTLPGGALTPGIKSPVVSRAGETIVPGVSAPLTVLPNSEISAPLAPLPLEGKGPAQIVINGQTDNAASAMERISAMAASIDSSNPSAPDSIGTKFDGSKSFASKGTPAGGNGGNGRKKTPASKKDDGPNGADASVDNTDGSAGQETVTREVSENDFVETQEIRFTNVDRKRIINSQLHTTIRLIVSKGSEWYWSKYDVGTPLRVLVGGKILMNNEVTHGETIEIGKITKKQMTGYYSAQIIKRWPIAVLRKRLIKDLQVFNKYKATAPRVINMKSKVRVIRFHSYKEAKKLAVNMEEPIRTPIVREKVTIPKELANANRFAPKLVIVDLRLFGDEGIPFPLLEDMGKLMKSGMYFVFLSDKKMSGPDSVESLISGDQPNWQRDETVRYKLMTLADDGNHLAEYHGPFAHNMDSPQFESADLDVMEHVAASMQVQGTFRRPSQFSMTLKKGADAEAFAKTFQETVFPYGIDESKFFIKVEEREGKPQVTVRPASIASAIPHVLKVMQDHEGLFVLPSDMMVITRNKELLEATKGAVHPSLYTEAQGAALVDTSFASILGEYRINVPGDMVASASRISSFLYDKNRLIGGGSAFDYSIYMLMGHVMHSAFNWLIWQYRMTGVLPDAKALVDRGIQNWVREDEQRVKSLLRVAGETMAGYQEVMESRLRTMHTVTADALKQYPIVIGTELPGLEVWNRYKKGEFLHRDIMRFIYDFVVARETPEGIEVRVMDFKTGQTPTIQNLSKDTQVLLYDGIPRRSWKDITVPYSVVGKPKPVANHGVRFIFPVEGYEPTINEWNRVQFEKWFKNVMNRIRRFMDPATRYPKKKKPVAKKRGKSKKVTAKQKAKAKTNAAAKRNKRKKS